MCFVYIGMLSIIIYKRLNNIRLIKNYLILRSVFDLTTYKRDRPTVQETQKLRASKSKDKPLLGREHGTSSIQVFIFTFYTWNGTVCISAFMFILMVSVHCTSLSKRIPFKPLSMRFEGDSLTFFLT